MNRAERREYEAAAERVRPEFMDYLDDHAGEHLDLDELALRFGITEETARQWAFEHDAGGRWEE